MKMARGPRPQARVILSDKAAIQTLAAALANNSRIVVKQEKLRLDIRLNSEQNARKLRNLLSTGTVDGTRLSITSFPTILHFLTITADIVDNHNKLSQILHFLTEKKDQSFYAKYEDLLIPAFAANDFKVEFLKNHNTTIISQDSAAILQS